MADGPDDETPQPIAGVVRTVPFIYFNASMARATQWELSLDIGFATGRDEPTDVAVRIVTSWEHAKSMRDMLDRVIAHYEEAVGPIREFEVKAETDEGGTDDHSNS